jgi:hypothetical protein
MKVTRWSGRADALRRLASREAPRLFAHGSGEHDLAFRPSRQMVSNGQIARHRTLQPSDRVLRRLVMTRLHHAGCAISSMIAVIPSGARTRTPQRANRGHLVHGAVREYHRRKLRRFTRGQTELDPPAEDLAGSDAMRRQTPANRIGRLLLLLHHRPLLLVDEAPTLRPCASLVASFANGVTKDKARS